MKSPKHLSHKPLVSVNDYDKVDGMYRNNTDAKALSIGYAQYDNNEIAMKVWRHVNGHWSRQSEELPIHRNLDLTILLLHVLFDEALCLEKDTTTGKLIGLSSLCIMRNKFCL